MNYYACGSKDLSADCTLHYKNVVQLTLKIIRLLAVIDFIFCKQTNSLKNVFVFTLFSKILLSNVSELCTYPCKAALVVYLT